MPSGTHLSREIKIHVNDIFRLEPHFNIAFMRNSVSTYAVSTNVACLRTTYDVTLGDDYQDQDQFCLYLKGLTKTTKHSREATCLEREFRKPRQSR